MESIQEHWQQGTDVRELFHHRISAVSTQESAFDGKRRIDILFRKIGMEPAATAGIPGALGDVLVCEIYTKRVSGEFDDAPKEAETERERPIKVWLARFDQTQMRYPGKLEAQTLFATIRGKLLFFRERPLTPGESQGMRK